MHEPRYLPGTSRCKFGCRCSDLISNDPPHVYDVTSDPTESNPIDPSSDTYKQLKDIFEKAIKEHRDSLHPVESQFSFRNVLWRPTLQDCCNGLFPFWCQCSDSKFGDEMYV